MFWKVYILFFYFFMTIRPGEIEKSFRVAGVLIWSRSAKKRSVFSKRPVFPNKFCFSEKIVLLLRKLPFIPLFVLNRSGAGFFQDISSFTFEITSKTLFFATKNVVLRLGNCQNFRLRRAVRRSGAQSKLAKSYFDP